MDDTVVLMISGHGVHDRDEYATYYYLTHETDLDSLAQTAVEFEELEELLQGFPPRQKLFLMDTCGSGEWDRRRSGGWRRPMRRRRLKKGRPAKGCGRGCPRSW